jgi:SAM-dependent methyltransferase
MSADPRRAALGFLARHPRLFNLVNHVFNHPLRRCSVPRRLIRGIRDGEVAVNLGSGRSDWGPKVTNLEMAPGPTVDVVADVTRLPFAADSLDYAFSIVVLEHVPEADRAVEEMQRTLKPGGRFYALLPFIQGYHDAPHDYRRFTKTGAGKLFTDHGLEVEAVRVGDGPTSSLVWILREWTAIALSFNIGLLYAFWFVVITVATVPLKLLDYLLSHYRTAHKIACNLVVEGTKR